MSINRSILKSIFIILIMMLTLISFGLKNNEVYAGRPGAGQSTQSTKSTIDSVMEGADDFLNSGDGTVVDKGKFQESANFIYNVLFAVALVISVIVGMILGMKYMMADSEHKAEIKQTLVPYTIAVVIMFGAFTIWKIVVRLLS